MSFDAPLLLYAAPVAALLVAWLAVWAYRSRVSHAARWSGDLARLARGAGRRGWILLGLATLSAGLALAGPRWGRRVVAVESKALNLVIAVDVSRSMLAEDVQPSRLGRAQREARRLIQDLASDRIGLIAFAGQSFIMSPLTVDASALQLLVDGLDPDISSVGGTALSRALKQGSDLLLGGSDVADRVLVLFSDGEAHDSLSDILAAADHLRRDGVRLILVAEGGREPAPIPVRAVDGSTIGQQRGPDGETVRTWRRDAVLTAIADQAQGAVVSAELKDQAGAVRELVLAYKRSPQATAVSSSRVLRAWLPLLLGALLLLGHTVTRRTAALAAFALLVSAPARAQRQASPTVRPSPPAPGSGAARQRVRHAGDRAWQSGDLRRAAELYVEDVRQGQGGDTAWYNAGTAGASIGDTALAQTALARAAESLDPDIRYRALYNLGLVELRLAAKDSASRDRHLTEARRRYREALLLKPGERAAEWNLELAVRRSPPKGGAAPSPSPQGGAAPRPEERPPAGLSASQADQILNSIAEEERHTRQQMRKRMSQARETRGEKDW